MRLLWEHWYADPEEKQAMLVKTGGDLVCIDVSE